MGTGLAENSWVTDAPRSYSTIYEAKRLGISLQTVQRWVDSGHLKAWKTLGGHRRIDAVSAETLFAQYEQTSGVVDAPADLTGPSSRRLVEVVIVDDDLMDRKLLATLVPAALPGAQ